MATVVLDFETSGLNPFYDDIIEIGAKIMNTNQNKSTHFEVLVKPKSGERIPHNITEITGITPKMLMYHGKEWKSAYTDFYNWLVENLVKDGGNSIVSHNGASFDFILFKRILRDIHEDLTHEYDIVYVDTLPVCRRLFRNSRIFKLTYLAGRLRIPNYGEHRALADVYTLEDLYRIIKVHLKKIGVEDARQIVAYANLEM